MYGTMTISTRRVSNLHLYSHHTTPSLLVLLLTALAVIEPRLDPLINIGLGIAQPAERRMEQHLRALKLIHLARAPLPLPVRAARALFKA